MLNWQWVLSDILGENSIKKRRSNSFQKAFERRLCFDRMAGVTGIFERISFLLQKSLFVFHDHRISFCGIYKNKRKLSYLQFLTHFLCFSYPEGLSSHVQEESLVAKPVHKSGAKNLVLDDFLPSGKRQVCRDNRRTNPSP